jgi:hypothetical protein
MRAFRAKSIRQKAAAEARRGDGLTDEQHRAMMAELDRRVMNFKEAWRACRDGRCRRHRQCSGPPFICNGNGGKPRWTSGQYRRLKRDIIRKPPQVTDTTDTTGNTSNQSPRRVALRSA